MGFNFFFILKPQLKLINTLESKLITTCFTLHLFRVILIFCNPSPPLLCTWKDYSCDNMEQWKKLGWGEDSRKRIITFWVKSEKKNYTDLLRLEGISRGHLVQRPCLSQATYNQLPIQMLGFFIISKDGVSTASLSNLSCSVTLRVRVFW